MAAWHWRRSLYHQSFSDFARVYAPARRNYAANRVEHRSDIGTPAAALKQVGAQLATVERKLEDALRNRDPLTGAGNRIRQYCRRRCERQALSTKTHMSHDQISIREVNDTYSSAMNFYGNTQNS